MLNILEVRLCMLTALIPAGSSFAHARILFGRIAHKYACRLSFLRIWPKFVGHGFPSGPAPEIVVTCMPFCSSHECQAFAFMIDIFL